MSLPLFDPIEIPPDTTLVDVNAIEDPEERQICQAAAFALYVDTELGGDWSAVPPRPWDPNEGAFCVLDEDGTPIGIVLIFDVEEL